MVSMNRLSTDQRARIVSALVEGNSLRATCRMTGASKNTVTKLLLDLGTVCSVYQDRAMRDLPCARLEVDEIWAFVGMKQRNVPQERQGELGIGDVWTWVAIDADTKLVPSYHVGARDLQDAYLFIGDLAKRLRNRVQLTTDGLKSYLLAVDAAFQGQIDYAQLHKIYASTSGGPGRYSPPVCTGIDVRTVSGEPKAEHISTSYIERQNLTMRMSMRRFTRLTNAWSKKFENLTAAVSLHFMHYNYVRVHSTLNTTPAVAAGVTDHVWTLPELIGLLEQAEATPTRRGPYRKTRERRQAQAQQISD
jgi:IS1 family transposase